MKILAFECSAGPASVAVIDNGQILSSCFVNAKLTHSQTLLPMAESVLNAANITFDDIEGIAVASGPGSFTGIRIGISAVKGLAAPKKLPCVNISTLYGMAHNFLGTNCIICAVMDARCNQVYNALFEINGKEVKRLCADRALMCNELADELSERYNDKNIIICGDGADMFYSYVKDNSNIILANETQIYQNASSVGLAAYDKFISGETVTHEELLPFYLRLPQAERELKKKNNSQEN